MILCELCASEMKEVVIRKGTMYQASIKRMQCTDKNCNHSYRTETFKDKQVRSGVYDIEIGILKPVIIT